MTETIKLMKAHTSVRRLKSKKFLKRTWTRF